jgi:TonB family protein
VKSVAPEVHDVYVGAHSRRHVASFAASILAHAALIALVFYSAPRLSTGGHDWVLAYLVEMGPGKGGTAGGAKGLPVIQVEPASIPDAPARSTLFDDAVAPKFFDTDVHDQSIILPRPGVMASLNPAGLRPFSRKSAGRSLSSQPRGSGGGSDRGSGSGDTTGDGFGGAGIRIAHADYGASPAPLYPVRSRERAEQGTVTLHVLVAIDGSVERIEIAQSSGFDDLDQSALDTVLKRWRFVAAKRSDGRPVESWVLVPIRFALR